MKKINIEFVSEINGLYGFKYIISSKILSLHPEIYLNRVIEQPIYNEIFSGVKVQIWGNILFRRK